MGELWNRVKLGDVIKTNTSSYSSRDNWSFVNYLDTGNITENVIEEIQYLDLSVGKLPSRAKRKVHPNSIVYSTVRPNQRHYGIIRKAPENFLVSTGFTVIDVEIDKADADFIYHLLTQNRYVELLHSIAEQSVSAYPSIKSSDIEGLEIDLPPLEVQKRISALLGMINLKIEVNNDINKNLEEQACAIYEEFINDHSCTKVHVEELIISSNTGADAIQKAPIVEYDTGVRCVRVGDMTNKRPYYEWGYTNVTDEVLEQYRLQKGDIIVTRTASLGLNCLIDRDLDAVYNNGLIRLKVNKQRINPLLLFWQFQTIDFSNYIARITGETSVRPNMKMNYLLQYEFDMVGSNDQAELVNMLEPLYLNQKRLDDENKRLADVRDALLPKLMSGEIDVSDVEI